MIRILFQLVISVCLGHESLSHSVFYGRSEHCNKYGVLNRRNSKVSLVADSLIDSFFYFSSAVSYNIKLADLEQVANRTIKPFCTEEIYHDY